MAISKLLAGTASTPGVSNGYLLADSVNALIDAHVPHLKALPTAAKAQADTVYNVVGFYSTKKTGGGKFVYVPDMSQSQHNGGTVIALPALLAWNGTQASLATLLNWAGSGSGCWVRLLDEYVTPEMFGAIGYPTVEDADAGSDQTLSISKAQKCGPVFFRYIYPVKNLQIEDGATFIGAGSHMARNYDAFKSDAPMLTAHASCTTADLVIKCREKKHWHVNGVNFDARGKCPTIEGGAFRPTLINVGIRGANGNNLGDASSPYTRGLHAINIIIREATNDNLSNIVDSYVESAFISDAGRHNINLGAGANSNIFTNGKIEWCRQHGVSMYQCNNISFSGTIFDRCGYNAIRIVDCSRITGNVILDRSGKYAEAPVSGQLDSHLFIQGSDGVSLNVVTNSHGDDGGGGYVSPRYSVSAANNSRNCVIYGDLSGCTLRPYYELEPSIDLSSAVGANLRPIGQYDSVASSGTTDFPINGYFINTFEHYIADVTVSAFNTATAQDSVASFKVFVTRAGGNAYIDGIYKYFSTPNNVIDSTGSPPLLVSASVNADGTGIVVRVVSTSPNTNNVRVTGDFGRQIY